MSANVETCFVVREPAWHGLGKVLENAPTAEQAIIEAGLDWQVNSKPLFHQIEGVGDVKIDNYVANVRSSDNKVLGVVTDRYSIVQNSEAFQFVDSLLDEGLTYESAGSLEGGKNIWLLGKMPKDNILGDELEPYVCFNNRHDGQGSIRVCMTPVRVVCNNTLNLALNTAKRSWATRHVGDLAAKLDEARYTLGMINEYVDALKVEAEKLAETPLSDNEVEAILNNIFLVKEDDSDLKKARVEQTKTTIYTCMLAPDILKFRNTAYGAMMAITDFADHAEPLRKTAAMSDWHFVVRMNACMRIRNSFMRACRRMLNRRIQSALAT